MTLNRTIAVGILAFAVLGAPASAGTLDDAVNADARGDYAKALRLIRPAANDGDAAAQFYLGTMYVTATACNRTIRPQHYGFEKQRSKATSSPKLISGSYIAMAAA